MSTLLQKCVDLAAKTPFLKVAHRMAISSLNTSTQQEKYDTSRAYYLAMYHQHNLEKYLKSGQSDGVEYEDVPESKLSRFNTRRRDFISDYHTKQITDLFKDVVAKGPYSPYPNPLKDERTDSDKYLEEKFDVKYDVGTSGPVIKHPHGFTMQIRKSGIDHPSAGYGVYVEGKVLPGTLLAIYPGTVHIPADLKQEFFDKRNTDYMIGRYDGYLIDGHQWDQQAFKRFRKFKQYAQFGLDIGGEFLYKYQNPFGIGNYINHPAIGGTPNVMSFSFNFLPEFDEELKQYIPNEDQRKISFIYGSQGVHVRSVVLIATRHINNEELYLNYRFNPKNKTPDWYHQPDENAAMRRWGKLGYIL